MASHGIGISLPTMPLQLLYAPGESLSMTSMVMRAALHHGPTHFCVTAMQSLSR